MKASGAVTETNGWVNDFRWCKRRHRRYCPDSPRKSERRGQWRGVVVPPQVVVFGYEIRFLRESREPILTGKIVSIEKFVSGRFACEDKK